LRTSLGPPPAGIINPEAHHLVGFGKADFEAQRILNEFGITPNSAGNSIWLSAEQHALTYGSYEKEYKNWVGRQFEGVTSKPEAIAVLDRIRDTLRDLKLGVTPPWRTGK
jgi:A nuclease family of the HNH/ENDO VII superfamily with conserved AHH